LYTAYSTDKESSKAQAASVVGETSKSTEEGKHATLSNPHPNQPSNPSDPQYQETPAFKPPHDPSIPPATAQEAFALEHELDEDHWDDRVESTPVSTDSILRVHGIYMSVRRHLEVRVDNVGKLVLWDAVEGKLWGTV